LWRSVPEITSTGQDTSIYYVVSEWIDNAKTLEEVWPLLQPSNKESIVSQLRSILRALRELEFPDGSSSYVGSAGHLPCTDPLVRDMGPFESIAEFNAGYTKVAKECFRGHHIEIIERLLAKNQTYRIVFTHGDLALSNILVRAHPVQTACLDTEDWRVVALIDWECAGWYPEHWEYLKLLNSVKWKSDWASYAQGLLDKHYDEDFMIDSRLRMYYR
jgi:thiamine kinase-like enzyme